MFGEADPADLTATWATELGPYGAEDLIAALKTMRTAFPDYPPTLFQFASLCRDSKLRREQRVMSLPDKTRVPIPAHIREQLNEFLRKSDAAH